MEAHKDGEGHAMRLRKSRMKHQCLALVLYVSVMGMSTASGQEKPGQDHLVGSDPLALAFSVLRLHYSIHHAGSPTEIKLSLSYAKGGEDFTDFGSGTTFRIYSGEPLRGLYYGFGLQLFLSSLSAPPDDNPFDESGQLSPDVLHVSLVPIIHVEAGYRLALTEKVSAAAWIGPGYSINIPVAEGGNPGIDGFGIFLGVDLSYQHRRASN